MLALVVFLNGMAVMVLEMAGARLLAPHLGTSIIVWTSLIGIILASLSLGYWLGGRLADKCQRATPQSALADPLTILSRLLMAASASVAMAAILGHSIPPRLMSLVASQHGCAVLAALTLFALPSMLCGMVSPFAMRLGITSTHTSGAVIGRLNAIATLGSIVGTFLGGFVLLSWFSTTTIIFGVALCLLAAATLVKARPLLPRILFALLLVALMAGREQYDHWLLKNGLNQGLPITIETAYASIRLEPGREDDRDVLHLVTDSDSNQSSMYLDAPAELLFPYTHFYGLGTSLNPQARHILMLGGGGYSVPKWLLAGHSQLHTSHFMLDVVELDPGMTKVAARWFEAPVEDERMRIFHEDARGFLNRAAGALPPPSMVAPETFGPYDLIFADIFNSWYSIPFHVGTKEAAAHIHGLLSKDGIYIMNIISAVTGNNSRLLHAVRNAFLQVFSEVHIFPMQPAYASNEVQNVILLAFRQPRPLPDPDRDILSPDLAALLARRWQEAFPSWEEDVPALRDNYAPVERYARGFFK